MNDPAGWKDPVREALVHGETAPAEFSSWPTRVCLRRLRLSFGFNRRVLAAKAGLSAAAVGRAEKGADVRLGTLRKIYAALGCRLIALPAGGLLEYDVSHAQSEAEWLDWKRTNARYFGAPNGVSVNSTVAGNSEMNRNAIASRAPMPGHLVK